MKTKTMWTAIFLFLICTVTIAAQTITVHGKITDENNQPMAGVSVCIKNTNIGTVSDINGEYCLNVGKSSSITFSFIGYRQVIVKADKGLINVQLKPDSNQLMECVVVGYGAVRRSDLCGSVSKTTYINTSRTGQLFAVTAKNNEEYGKFKENRFITSSQEALSTFSLDVDAASYSNIRRIINSGQQPPKDAVRIEEMINYFSYNYTKPGSEHPVHITTEGGVCPWNEKHKLVRIGVKAREIDALNLPATNFVFLIDVSGSMFGATKLELVKSSLKLLANNLRNNDRVAIVVYAGAAGEVLPSTQGSDRQKIVDALENLQAGGSTAGGAGIQLAYRIAEKNFIKNGNNRIIMCTDGDFNVGVSNNDELESLIESKRKTGVYLTILGYGMGNYKDSKLQTLAQKGNGNHAYIDNIQEANKVLVSEFGSTMYTVAKDVKLQVEFNPAYVNAYRLIGYESRLLNKEEFNDDTKDAGELGSGHTVTALYEIIPTGVKNSYGSVDELKYQKTKKKQSVNDANGEMLNVKLRYKLPDSDTSIKMETPLTLTSFNVRPSADFQFASSVAMFGQLLRESDFKGNATYDKVTDLARNGLDEDTHGYRREFIRLVEAVNQITK